MNYRNMNHIELTQVLFPYLRKEHKEHVVSRETVEERGDTTPSPIVSRETVSCETERGDTILVHDATKNAVFVQYREKPSLRPMGRLSHIPPVPPEGNKKYTRHVRVYKIKDTLRGLMRRVNWEKFAHEYLFHLWADNPRYKSGFHESLLWTQKLATLPLGRAVAKVLCTDEGAYALVEVSLLPNVQRTGACGPLRSQWDNARRQERCLLVTFYRGGRQLSTRKYVEA